MDKTYIQCSTEIKKLMYYPQAEIWAHAKIYEYNNSEQNKPRHIGLKESSQVWNLCFLNAHERL